MTRPNPSSPDEPLVADSVRCHLPGLKAGDPTAANALIDKYFARVVRAADRRLGERQRGGGGEDIAASVFESLWKRAASGGFSAADLADRDDLWRLLCHMLQRKVISHRRRENAQKRGGGATRGESFFASPGQQSQGMDGVAGAAFAPDELAALAERHDRLMELLGDELLREVAMLRLEGYEIADIAQRIGRGDRTVKRKLKLIREIWKRALGDEVPGAR